MSEDEITVPDYVPSSLSLPMHKEHCPKCRTETGFADTEFHIGGIFGTTPCGQTYSIEELKTLGEHICVICNKCGYQWSERPDSGA